jgi:DNA-binding transcriptional regulator GbsR (MarR family)
MEKFTHSEVFEDEMYQQLLAMHEYILKYEKFLNDTLTHLKEEIHKFSNALPKTN